MSKAWTKDEDYRLYRMIRHGRRYIDIARELGRPYSSVMRRAERLDIQKPSEPEPRQIWSEDWPDMRFEDARRACRKEPPLRDRPDCSAGLGASSMADVVAA